MRKLWAVCLLAVLTMVVWSDPSSAAVGSTVRGVQQIGRDTLIGPPGSESDTTVEPHIAVDRNDPQHVVAVYQEGRFQDGGSADIGYATSTDGGRTWTFGNLPGLTVSVGGQFGRASDPSVAFGPNGEVYAGSLLIAGSTCDTGVAVNRSDDGGLTWNDPVLVDADCINNDDKTWLAVDTFPSSPHFGRVYMAWDESPPGSGLIDVMKWSDNQGETWSAPVTVANSSQSGFPVAVLVQPTGNVSVQWTALKIRTSTNGGQSFGPVVTIGTFQGHDPSGIRTGGGFGIGSAAVDPVTGKLFVAWQDGRFRSDGLNDAVLSTSTDGGQTWSPAKRINQDGTQSRIDHFNPAVAAFGGVVHVTYMTQANGNRLLNERYTMSSDGGQTFSSEFRLGPAIDLKYAAEVFFNGTKFLGDYFAVAAADGVAHPVWCRSSRPPIQETYHQTTWSAVITV